MQARPFSRFPAKFKRSSDLSSGSPDMTTWSLSSRSSALKSRLSRDVSRLPLRSSSVSSFCLVNANASRQSRLLPARLMAVAWRKRSRSWTGRDWNLWKSLFELNCDCDCVFYCEINCDCNCTPLYIKNVSRHDKNQKFLDPNTFECQKFLKFVHFYTKVYRIKYWIDFGFGFGLGSHPGLWPNIYFFWGWNVWLWLQILIVIVIGTVLFFVKVIVTEVCLKKLTTWLYFNFIVIISSFITGYQTKKCLILDPKIETLS